MAFNFYPYTDFHELNLDWVIRKMKELGQAFNDFEAVNKITNAGAWDITKQYQAWTIVSDNNIGYISLKPVPVGVAITNTEYWGLVADYDILITDLSNRISTLENEVIAINQRIDDLDDKSYVFITDSYGTYTNASGRNFIQEAMHLTGISSYYCFSQGSAGFSQSGIYNFLNVLQANESAIADKTKITDVVVCGGANDQITADMGNIIPGITAFINYVKANYPNAKIHIGHFTHGINPTYVNNITTSYLLYKECVNYGASYIENSQYIMARLSMYQADNVHPTALGILKLAEYLAAWILDGHIDVHETVSGVLENGSNGTIVADLMTLIQHNGTVSIVGDQGGCFANVSLASAMTLTAGSIGTKADVARLSDGFIIPRSANALSVPVMFSGTGGSVSASGALYAETIGLGPVVKLGLFVLGVASGSMSGAVIMTGDQTLPIF